MRKKNAVSMCIFALLFGFWNLNFLYATPTTHVWSPSTDIQPFKKIHLTSDFYVPTTGKGTNADNYDQHNYVQQVYGLTFGLLSDRPEENLLGRIFSPLGKITAEAGFDYKKGFGSSLDTYPWYFHFKAGVGEGAAFKHAPAFAAGIYDLGIKHSKTDNNIWYLKAAKTLHAFDLNWGRFSAGYFWGNGRLLRDKNGLRDNAGVLLAWERVVAEFSDRLWVCVDYQGTQSAYGALNLGFSWKFTDSLSVILGYDLYQNRNLTDTVTLQLDIDF